MNVLIGDVIKVFMISPKHSILALMNRFLLCVFLLVSGAAAAEGTSIYRSYDAEGNPVFSDEPMPDSESFEIREIQTVPAENAEFEYTRKEKTEDVKYTRLDILYPENDTSVRENAGNLTVTIESEPALRPGHSAHLYLDGVEVAAGSQTSFSLENLDRGTHTLSASIRAGEKPIIESDTVTFTLHRHSRLHP